MKMKKMDLRASVPSMQMLFMEMIYANTISGVECPISQNFNQTTGEAKVQYAKLIFVERQQTSPIRSNRAKNGDIKTIVFSIKLTAQVRTLMKIKQLYANRWV